MKGWNSWLPESNEFQSEEDIPDSMADEDVSWFSQDIALGIASLTSDSIIETF